MRIRVGLMGFLAGMTVAGSLLLPAGAEAQEGRQWERRREAVRAPVMVFSATQAINLPTAETLHEGDWQFEIAHRFFPAVSEGSEALWGLDGPALMRIGLGYAPTDQALVTLARSNYQDNYDLQVKLRVLEVDHERVPLMVAIQGGVALSTDVPGRESSDPANRQYYGQLILNALVADRLALGLVPSYLHNVLLDEIDPVKDVFWGVNGQFFLTDVLSVLGEWRLGDGRFDAPYDPGAFGLELETGGHFFKLFLTNSVRLNPSQFLVGSEYEFEPGEWRLGFAITRLLRF